MANYHFNANVFGNPSFPLTQTQNGQFKSNPVRDVGRGLFAAYNPTAPLPVNAQFQWDGATLATFRAAWENNNQLNYGTDWFTMDLPLMFDHADVADVNLFPYNTKAEFIFAVTIGIDGAGAYGVTADLFGSAPHGSIVGEKMMGLWVYAIKFNDPDTIYVTFAETSWGSPLPAQPVDLEVYYPDTNETVNLVRTSGAYIGNGSIDAPLAQADWRASEGETRLVSIRPYVQQFQRYPVHVIKPYTAVMSGYDRWEVDIELDVDVSPQLVIS